MPSSFSPQESALLTLIPTDGSSAGGGSLRDKLGWDEATFVAVREALLKRGVIEKARGGSIRRINALAAKTELFAPSEIETAIPELARAQRAASDLATTAKKVDTAAVPISEHRFIEATRKNLPSAGDALGHVEEAAPITYAYDPHRPPVLRFNEGIIDERTRLIRSDLKAFATGTLSRADINREGSI